MAQDTSRRFRRKVNQVWDLSVPPLCLTIYFLMVSGQGGSKPSSTNVHGWFRHSTGHSRDSNVGSTLAFPGVWLDGLLSVEISSATIGERHAHATGAPSWVSSGWPQTSIRSIPWTATPTRGETPGETEGGAVSSGGCFLCKR